MSKRSDDPSVDQEDTMNHASDNTDNKQVRILLHSQRNIYSNIHFRLGLYEFEDIIRQVDSVDLMAPGRTRWFKYGTRIANRLASFNTSVNPGISKIKIQKDYDLFFAVAHFPRDLIHLMYVDDWKSRCKKSICWLNEIWISELAKSKYFLKVLSQFDYVMIQWVGSIKAIQEEIKTPCLYLPYGIDAALCNPYPKAPQRVIDVYSIGRRAEETHQTLLTMVRENKIFYVYDTISGSQIINPEEHRLLFANMAKRSRYFIVNPGKADTPEEMAGQIEFGNRFFEGAASGNIMIGETPENEKFKEVFDWPDAVIHLPFGSTNIDKIIDELDRQPERQETIRRNNVVQTLLRHDWVYRWESILEIAGLEPLPELLERKKRLKDLADLVEKT